MSLHDIESKMEWQSKILIIIHRTAKNRKETNRKIVLHITLKKIIVRINKQKISADLICFMTPNMKYTIFWWKGRLCQQPICFPNHRLSFRLIFFPFVDEKHKFNHVLSLYSLKCEYVFEMNGIWLFIWTLFFLIVSVTGIPLVICMYDFLYCFE